MTVVFGTVCLDRVRRLPHLPSPGGYVEVLHETVSLGGEAANTATALVAWGGAPILASHPLGDGAEGADLRARVLARKLDLRELCCDEPAEAPICDVLVTPDGQRTMIGRGFTALDLAIDLKSLPLFASGLFAADPNVPKASRQALRLAAKAGMTTYLMDFHDGDDPLVPGAYWQSSTDWIGRWGDERRNLAVVQNLVDQGLYAVLTDGPNGLVAGGPGRPPRLYPAFPAPERIDTTGAGDIFRAGMLHGLRHGWGFSICLQFASAAGALSVRHSGASARIPTLAEIASHIATNPNTVAAYV